MDNQFEKNEHPHERQSSLGRTDRSARVLGKRRLKKGSYALVLTAVSLASILVINIIARTIPKQFTTFDVSNEKLYSIGEISKGVLDALEEPVTLRLVTEAGQEDEAVGKLVESYAAYSDKIVLDEIDAIANPTFAAGYGEESIPLNSVIAAAGDRHQVASYYNFYGYDSYYSEPSVWDAEGQITSAIAAVAQNESSKVRFTTGHDELEISSEMADSLKKANMTSEGINLLAEEIPEDTDALMICAPARDFGVEEVKKVLQYLENGGRLLLMTMSDAVTGAKTPNLDRIAESYGVSRKGGLVLEGDTSSYVQAPYLILPGTGNSEVTDGLSNLNIVCALPEALDAGDTDEAVYTVTTLLATSPGAYIKQEIADTVEKESGDEEGQFVLGVAIEETLFSGSMGEPDVDLNMEFEEETGSAREIMESGEETGSAREIMESAEETGTVPDTPEKVQEEADRDDSGDNRVRAARILYYSTPCLFSSAALSTLIQQQTALPEGNTALFAKSMAYLTDRKTAVSVEPKTLAVPQTVIDGRTEALLGNAAMIALPVLVLIAGFIIFRRRRLR